MHCTPLQVPQSCVTQSPDSSCLHPLSSSVLLWPLATRFLESALSSPSNHRYCCPPCSMLSLQEPRFPLSFRHFRSFVPRRVFWSASCFHFLRLPHYLHPISDSLFFLLRALHRQAPPSSAREREGKKEKKWQVVAVRVMKLWLISVAPTLFSMLCLWLRLAAPTALLPSNQPSAWSLLFLTILTPPSFIPQFGSV